MKKVVIVGGGFSGSKIAKKLQNKFDVILIDKKDYFEFTPGILRVISYPNHFGKITIKHKNYLKKAKFMLGEVYKFDEKFVYLKRKKIRFDYLVVCSGSSYEAPFKDQIIIASRASQLKEQNLKVIKSKEIGIIGAGPVGVELAAEIIEKYPLKKIKIIDSKDRIMFRMNKKSSEYGMNYLKNKNVEIYFNSRIIKINKNIAYTEKDQIKAEMFFLCSGIKPNNKFITKSFGDYSVNEYLQINGHKNIFIGGDVAQINEEKLAQNAHRHAEIIIKNIINLEFGKLPIKYNTQPAPMIVSLGKWKGIFEYKNIVITGLIPGLLKSLVEIKEMISLRYF